MCAKIEFSIIYGCHFFGSKNTSWVPSWHSAEVSLGQLRDIESTKKLHNSNKRHLDLIWLFGIWINIQNTENPVSGRTTQCIHFNLVSVHYKMYVSSSIYSHEVET